MRNKISTLSLIRAISEGYLRLINQMPTLCLKVTGFYLLNNKNTNYVETHTCNILLLVFLDLSIVRCWEAIQHMRYLREYSNQREKILKSSMVCPSIYF